MDEKPTTIRIYPGELRPIYYTSVLAFSTTPTVEVIRLALGRLQIFEDKTLYQIYEGRASDLKEKWSLLSEDDFPVQVQERWRRPESKADKEMRFFLRRKEHASLVLAEIVSQYISPEANEGRIEDMCRLEELSEQAMLSNLRARFSNKCIYTYVGSILISVNPYYYYSMYNPKYTTMYQGKALGQLPPHIFAVADVAYHSMLGDRLNQTVIISGESGAGKTESTKFLLHHLMSLSAKMDETQSLELITLGTGPVLEAFGNARTVANNNSSRFGKFILVKFKENGAYYGASIEKYLLEKSRIISQASEERNYHVFYYLLAGADAELRGRLQLLDMDQYNYLTQGSSLAPPEGAEEYHRLRQSLSMLSFSDDVQMSMFTVLSAILHIGNIQFRKKENEEAAQIQNTEAIEVVSTLLQVEKETLRLALTTRKSRAGGSDFFVTPYKLAEAIATRDSMARALYGALFDWIVDKVNDALTSSSARGTHKGNSIGVLDIFGFEVFQKNSFEQFCINYANEQLQQYFNKHIFKLEQAEYAAEDIEWSSVEFVDNQDCLDLIAKKPTGLLSLLDEECSFPGADDNSLFQKFERQHKAHSHYRSPQMKLKEPIFTIVHYASNVSYCIQGFREKNRDLMRQDIVDVLKTSKMDLVRALIGLPPYAIHRWRMAHLKFMAVFAFRKAGKVYQWKKEARLSSSVQFHLRRGSTPPLLGQEEALDWSMKGRSRYLSEDISSPTLIDNQSSPEAFPLEHGGRLKKSNLGIRTSRSYDLLSDLPREERKAVTIAKTGSLTYGISPRLSRKHPPHPSPKPQRKERKESATGSIPPSRHQASLTDVREGENPVKQEKPARHERLLHKEQSRSRLPSISEIQEKIRRHWPRSMKGRESADKEKEKPSKYWRSAPRVKGAEAPDPRVLPTLGRQSSARHGPSKTVSAQFQASLVILMERLEQTNPFFIRCIKSNNQKAPCQFDDELVLRQLRYTGMMETIKIRKAGYSVRMTFEDFYEKFQFLMGPQSSDLAPQISQFISGLGFSHEDFQTGRTKVFMRDAQKHALQEELHDKVLHRIVVIQRWVRAKMLRCRFLHMRRSAITIQSAVRGWIARRQLDAIRKRICNAVLIQAAWRGFASRKNFVLQKQAAIILQAHWRGRIARKRFAIMVAEFIRLEEERRRREAEEQAQREKEEQERLEALRKEKEEQERLEALRKEKEEQERLEASRKEKEEQERLEALRKEKEEQDRLEALRKEKEEQDRLEALRKEKEEQERLQALKREEEEQERLEALRREQETLRTEQERERIEKEKEEALKNEEEEKRKETEELQQQQQLKTVRETQEQHQLSKVVEPQDQMAIEETTSLVKRASHARSDSMDLLEREISDVLFQFDTIVTELEKSTFVDTPTSSVSHSPVLGSRPLPQRKSDQSDERTQMSTDDCLPVCSIEKASEVPYEAEFDKQMEQIATAVANLEAPSDGENEADKRAVSGQQVSVSKAGIKERQQRFVSSSPSKSPSPSGDSDVLSRSGNVKNLIAQMQAATSRISRSPSSSPTHSSKSNSRSPTINWRISELSLPAEETEKRLSRSYTPPVVRRKIQSPFITQEKGKDDTTKPTVPSFQRKSHIKDIEAHTSAAESHKLGQKSENEGKEASPEINTEPEFSKAVTFKEKSPTKEGSSLETLSVMSEEPIPSGETTQTSSVETKIGVTVPKNTEQLALSTTETLPQTHSPNDTGICEGETRREASPPDGQFAIAELKSPEMSERFYRFRSASDITHALRMQTKIKPYINRERPKLLEPSSNHLGGSDVVSRDYSSDSLTRRKGVVSVADPYDVAGNLELTQHHISTLEESSELTRCLSPEEILRLNQRREFPSPSDRLRLFSFTKRHLKLPFLHRGKKHASSSDATSHLTTPIKHRDKSKLLSTSTSEKEKFEALSKKFSRKTSPPPVPPKERSEVNKRQSRLSPDQLAHNFKPVPPPKCSTCAVCHKGFSGFMKQALKCVDCDVPVHRHCEERASHCKAQIESGSYVTMSRKKVVKKLEDLDDLGQFLLDKIDRLSRDGSPESLVDRVFKKSLHEFHASLVSSYSLSVQAQESEGAPGNIEEPEVVLTVFQLVSNFSNIFRGIAKREGLNDQSYITIGMNQIKTFLDEFSKTRSRARLVRSYSGTFTPATLRRKTVSGKEVQFKVYKGHQFVSQQFKVKTVCEYCAKPIPLLAKGEVCEACGYTCHEDCLKKTNRKCEGKSRGKSVSQEGKRKHSAKANSQFGVPLQCLVPPNSTKIPAMLVKCLKYIESHGLYSQGIYRKSAGASSKKAVRTALEEDPEGADLEGFSVHAVASAVGAFFRELPEPLLTGELSVEFIRAVDLTDQEERLETLHHLISRLPEINHIVFERLVFHLARVAQHEHINKMSPYNLAVIFAPCLLQGSADGRNPQDMLRDLEKQTVCLEAIIIEQVGKLNVTLRGIETLTTVARDTACRLTLLIEQDSSQETKAPTPEEKPVTTAAAPAESAEVKGQDKKAEERKRLTTELQELERERVELTVNLPKLEPFLMMEEGEEEGWGDTHSSTPTSPTSSAPEEDMFAALTPTHILQPLTKNRVSKKLPRRLPSSQFRRSVNRTTSITTETPSIAMETLSIAMETPV